MSSNQHVVNICLGFDQQMFRFDPSRLHDIYAVQSTLYVELLVDDSFVIPYEFSYLDLEDLLSDFRALQLLLPEKHD